MRVVVSSNGADLDAQASHTFGRCPMYLFVDTESMRFEVAANPGSDASSGAGVQAAQFVTGVDIQAIITGEVGPKAMNVLKAARVPIYLFRGGAVRQAVEDFKAGKLPTAPGSEAPEEQAELQANRTGNREEEIQVLKSEMMSMRHRLTQVLERIQQLQEGS